jgi:hypothetical protein
MTRILVNLGPDCVVKTVTISAGLQVRARSPAGRKSGRRFPAGESQAIMISIDYYVTFTSVSSRDHVARPMIGLESSDLLYLT